MASVVVSIVIVNYNGAKFVAKLLNSLSLQTYRNFEIIFVDNNSTDDSVCLIERLMAEKLIQNVHVKIIRNKANLGYCGGNNVGLYNAHGKYVVFLNNDTYVSETWLEELIVVMNNCPTIGACQSRLIQPVQGNIQNDGHLLDFYGWSQSLVFETKKDALSEIPIFVSGASFMARKNDLLKIHGFDEKLFLGDYDLCLRLRLLGYTMAVTIRSICYHYGGHASRTIVSQKNMLYNYEKERVRVLLKVYSFRHFIRRIPILMFLMAFEPIVETFRIKNPLLILSFPRALLWNLNNLKSTFLVRYNVKNTRVLNDHDLEQKMPKYIIYLTRQPVIRM